MEVKKQVWLAVFLIQIIYAGYFLLTKLAFDVGMNTFIFVFYRQAAATLFVGTFAFFLEWKSAPPLSVSIFLKIFMLSLLGITMSLEFNGVALLETTASLGAATTNTLPVITFFLAVLFRMEKVKLNTSPEIMKMGGIILCISGVLIIAFYNGPFLKLISHPMNLSKPHVEIPCNNKTWIKGVFLMLLSNFTWSLWMILQGIVLKSYPSKLLLTAQQCFFSTIQSFIVAIIFSRDPSEWRLGFNFRLLSVLYSGVVVTGVTYYLQSWVIEKKGPVFLATTTPVILVFTIILSVAVLGEGLSLGRVLGEILIIGGLYFVLWGKMKEEKRSMGEILPNGDAEKVNGQEGKQQKVLDANAITPTTQFDASRSSRRVHG